MEIDKSAYSKVTLSSRGLLEKLENNPNLGEDDKVIINTRLKKELHSPLVHTLLAIFFPINHFLLGKVAKGLLFWFTGGGFGFWYIWNWFVAGRNVKSANDLKVSNIYMQLK